METVINDQGKIQVRRYFLTLRHHFEITEGLVQPFHIYLDWLRHLRHINVPH
jgi:hypothetical protein